jgi:lipopolysaccharide cholinephosphotransferase
MNEGFGNILEVDDNLRKLQDVELEMLIELDRICRKNGILYQLFGGTLLGAVRHKGFIPWDDDIDVCMLREDYNRFLEICKKDISEKYFLQTFETDSQFFHSFARIRKNNTLALQKQYSGMNMHHGIFIDIFPLDNIEEGILGKFQYYTIRFIREMKKIKLRKKSSNSKVKGFVKRIIINITKPIPIKLYNALETKLATIYEKIETKKSSLLVEAIKINYKRCTINSSNFKDIIEIEFEGHKFWAPKNYDVILTNMYGDYMSLPPVEERKGHHKITELRF